MYDGLNDSWRPWEHDATCLVSIGALRAEYGRVPLRIMPLSPLFRVYLRGDRSECTCDCFVARPEIVATQRKWFKDEWSSIHRETTGVVNINLRHRCRKWNNPAKRRLRVGKYFAEVGCGMVMFCERWKRGGTVVGEPRYGKRVGREPRKSDGRVGEHVAEMKYRSGWDGISHPDPTRAVITDPSSYRAGPCYSPLLFGHRLTISVTVSRRLRRGGYFLVLCLHPSPCPYILHRTMQGGKGGAWGL